MIGATYILISALCLLIGILMGAWGYRTFFLDQRSRHLEQQLNALTQEHEAYQASVSKHFDRSAVLINQLTDSYQDVHEHLRTGAKTLCQHQNSWDAETDNHAIIEHTHSKSASYLSTLNTPRDYAVASEDPASRT